MPLPDRDKDYIANPKPNGYQSIHLSMTLPSQTSYSGEGVSTADDNAEVSSIFAPCMELQIRTQRMDDLAEAGEASHASYKGGLDSRQVRQLKEWTYALKQQLVRHHRGKLLLPSSADPVGDTSSFPSSMRSPPSTEDIVGRAARELFSNWDADGNGELTLEEVQEQLRELGSGYSAAEADAEALILMARDGEGLDTQHGPNISVNGYDSTSKASSGSEQQQQKRGITLHEFSRFVKKVSLQKYF